MVRIAVALGVLVIAGTVAGPVGAHSPPPPPVPFDSPDRVEVTYGVRIADDPAELFVRASVDIPSTVDALAIELPPGAEVVGAREFEAEDGAYVADGDSSAGLTYRVPRDAPGLWLDASANDEWAVFARSTLRDDVTVNPEPGRNPTVVERVHGWGIVPRFPGNAVTLMGDYGVVESTTPGEHRFRVIVPEGVSLTADPDAVLASLAHARHNLEMGHRHDDVVGFVAGRSDEPRRFVPRGVPEFVVSSDARPGGPANPWVHQYVHTRQNFSTTPDLRWLYEGSAAYEAALLSLQRGSANWTAFQDVSTTGQYASVDLSDPNAARFRAASRAKGAAVVAALDERIRRATDGRRSFDAVLRRMNQRNQAVDTATFERIVADVAGEPGSGEVGGMVTGTFEPEPPADPLLFTDEPLTDPDGDGLSVARERAAGTNPFVADTDGDGTGDGTEVARDTDPTAGPTTATATPSSASPTGTATEADRATATPATTAEAVSPVRVGAFFAWLLLVGTSAWVVSRR